MLWLALLVAVGFALIAWRLYRLELQGIKTMAANFQAFLQAAAITALTAQVNATNTYLAAVPGLIAAAGTNDAALAALTAQVTSDVASLAAGTPVAPPTPAQIAAKKK